MRNKAHIVDRGTHGGRGVFSVLSMAKISTDAPTSTSLRTEKPPGAAHVKSGRRYKSQ